MVPCQIKGKEVRIQIYKYYVDVRATKLNCQGVESLPAKTPLHRGLSKPGQSICSDILAAGKVLSCEMNVAAMDKIEESL